MVTSTCYLKLCVFENSSSKHVISSVEHVVSNRKKKCAVIFEAIFKTAVVPCEHVLSFSVSARDFVHLMLLIFSCGQSAKVSQNCCHCCWDAKTLARGFCIHSLWFRDPGSTGACVCVCAQESLRTLPRRARVSPDLTHIAIANECALESLRDSSAGMVRMGIF